jgi:Ca2+-binding RTX toxin-like protein
VQQVRIPPIRVAVIVVAVAAFIAALSGGTSTAAEEPQTATASLSDFGPTKSAPSGGVPGSRASGTNRWKYRGTLGKLGLNEQVVPPVAAAPVDDPDLAPLTGKPAGLLDRRAVLVKIDNVSRARPQVNINSADIVYEELVEAGFTRLAAVFHSKTKNDLSIGPVRSARSTDIGIASSFRWPIFAFSGANSIFGPLIAKAPLADRGHETFAQLYRRSSNRAAPHNLFTTSSDLLRSATKGNPPKPHFVYRDGELPPDTLTASTVQLRFQKRIGVPVRYEWSEKAGGWKRWQNGSRHVDSRGVQVAPHNLIVQIVPYIDAGLTDKHGSDLYEAQLVGTGKALVFTDGHVIEATWTKPTLKSVTTFTDADNNHVGLTPGRTWVALVPPGGVTFNSLKCKGQIATIAGSSGRDTLRGTESRDIIAAGGGGDLVYGGGGNDLICGDDGNDQLFGERGADKIVGGSGADDLRGGEGNDMLNGGRGNDQLHGGPGVDRLRGKKGSDQLYGQESVDDLGSVGNDVLLRGP